MRFIMLATNASDTNLAARGFKDRFGATAVPSNQNGYQVEVLVTLEKQDVDPKPWFGPRKKLVFLRSQTSPPSLPQLSSSATWKDAATSDTGSITCNGTRSSDTEIVEGTTSGETNTGSEPTISSKSCANPHSSSYLQKPFNQCLHLILPLCFVDVVVHPTVLVCLCSGTTFHHNIVTILGKLHDTVRQKESFDYETTLLDPNTQSG